jgi:hypothetical protein
MHPPPANLPLKPLLRTSLRNRVSDTSRSAIRGIAARAERRAEIVVEVVVSAERARESRLAHRAVKLRGVYRTRASP